MLPELKILLQKYLANMFNIQLTFIYSSYRNVLLLYINKET